ncbi:hypothetical protein A2U01_0106677, partial [Trifolium medium]|nr:hypothetical protein [Trifolium medium]
MASSSMKIEVPLAGNWEGPVIRGPSEFAP